MNLQRLALVISIAMLSGCSTAQQKISVTETAGRKLASTELTLKEALQQFEGRYKVAECEGNLKVLKVGDFLNLAVEPNPMNKDGFLFHYGGIIGDGNGYQFNDFTGSVVVRHQKTKHSCLDSEGDWSVEGKILTANSHIRYFDKWFCHFERRSLEDTSTMKLILHEGILLHTYERTIGGKTEQEGVCKLIKES